MRLYRLDKTQEVRAPLEGVFSFFSNPENLKKLTPPSMNMRMLTPGPIPMHSGTVIDYTVAVARLRIHWRACILEYEPPFRFVDTQLKGPYAFWHHTHTFEDKGNRTAIHDQVVYGLPFGPLGTLAHVLFAKRQLGAVFAYRERVLAREMTRA